MKKTTIMNTFLIAGLATLTLAACNTGTGASQADIEKAVMAAVEKVEAEKVGGKENYKILKKIYASDEFKTQQKQMLEGGLAQVNGEQASNSTDSETLKLDTETIEKLTKDITIYGNESADIIIIEYADIQCPACKMHNQNGAIRNIVKNFPDDVKSTFKNFPLSFHKQAQYSAEAVECVKKHEGAEVSEKFIEKLFHNVGERDDTPAGIDQSIEELNLDKETINACITSKEMSDVVEGHMDEAQAIFGIRGTPANIILNTKTGEYKNLSGAQPYPAFEQAINELLGK